MKNKFTKIFTLALSTLLLMGCFIGFSISAEEAGEPNVEIVFNNLEYGDNISILYATKVSGVTPDAMKMNFYAKNEEGEYALVHATEENYVDDVTVNGNTDTYNIFKSPGIAPKFMPEIIYAQLIVSADGVEYASNMSRFSVVEYCYKRLYKDTGITADQKDLYNHVIGYGTAAQKVLGYNTDDTPAHYFYVNAKDAVVDTVEINGNTYSYSAGIFKADANIALKYSNDISAGEYATWLVSYKAADGTATSESLADNTLISVTDKHIIAVPEIIPYENNYEGADPIADYTITSANEAPHFNAYVTDDPAPEYDGDKAFLVSQLYPCSSTNNLIKIPVIGTVGDTYVFTADVRWQMTVPNAAGTGTTSTAQDIIVKHMFKDTNGTSAVVSNIEYSKDANGTLASMILTNGDRSKLSGYMAYDTWYNIRIELYNTENGYLSRYFINDLFAGEDTYSKSNGDIASIVLCTYNNNANVYYDNLSFVRSSAEYTAIEDDIAGSASEAGTYYNSEAAGVRYDFTSTTRGPLLGQTGYNGADRITEGYRLGYDDGYALYRKELDEGETTTHMHMYYNIGSSLTSGSHVVMELDIAFGGIADEGAFFQFNTFNYGVMKSSLYLMGTADGNATVSSWHSTVDGTVPVFESNKWYNLRVEYFTDGKIKLYVNDVYACTVGALDFGSYTSNYNRIDFMMHSASSTEWLAYDNLYIGYDAD